MAATFSHSKFQVFSFEDVPLDRDLYLMDEKWLRPWERSYLSFFDGKDFKNVGYISYAAVREAREEALEISWYPNTLDRFHEVSVLLPRSAFVACVDVPDCDEKPHIFVKSEWLNGLHLRPYSAFVLIDAIGVKSALIKGKLTGDRLVELRNRIDEIADATPGVAFVSFADSLLLKANWFVGKYDSEVNYSYDPERIIKLIPQVAAAYRDVLGMQVYAVLAQGVNEYGDTALIHQSQLGGHLSLNSLGLPFAQLLSIDEAARQAIRNGEHDRFELYIDEHFFHSIRFRYGFDKRAQPSARYQPPMSSTQGKYYCTSLDIVLDNLNVEPPLVVGKRKRK
jgi:hypothetical protein